MQLVLILAPSPVAMLATKGFSFLGAVVDEDGTVNHILSVLSGRWLRHWLLKVHKDCNRRVNRCEGTGRAIRGMEESGDLSKYIRFASRLVVFQSYSIRILGLSTSCPLPPPAIQGAIPQGDTIMPFCEGL